MPTICMGATILIGVSFGGCLCVAERTLTVQFLQLFHIIILTLMFIMNVIKTLLFLGCNSGGSLSKLITYSL